jgi:hypothetical protein
MRRTHKNENDGEFMLKRMKSHVDRRGEIRNLHEQIAMVFAASGR